MCAKVSTVEFECRLTTFLQQFILIKVPVGVQGGQYLKLSTT